MHQAVVETKMCDRCHRVGPQIAVAEHHSLGAAGRPAGIEQASNVVLAALCIRHRFDRLKRVLLVDGLNVAA